MRMKKFAHINVTVNILKQGNRYIVYSPVLDLSTSGKTKEEARRRFGEASVLLIEELDRAGTLGDVLRELGWQQIRNKWSPPKIISRGAVGVRVPVAV